MTTVAPIWANANAWFSNYGGKSIAVIDKIGRPLTPPEGHPAQA
jgi:hypothetical protein